MTRTEDSLFKWDPKMLTVHQLNLSIDSINRLRSSNIARVKTQVRPSLMFYKYKDSTWSVPDSLKNKAIKSMNDIIPDSMLSTSYEKAVSTINSVKGFIDIAQTEYSSTEELLRKNRVEWNRKFSLSFACIVLFMIGAPLGSIIRKGGPWLTAGFCSCFFCFISFAKHFW
jgi:lipopolysaccharide export system permease protein